MTAAVARPLIEPFGDAALLVRLGDGIDPAVSRRVRALSDHIRAATAADAGAGGGVAFGRPTPGHATLLVPYDALRSTLSDASSALRALIESVPGDLPPDADAAAAIEIGVRYGGTDGPDLESVARSVGLAPMDVAALHASVTYDVLLLGFAPGFAYLGTLPDALRVPRRESPRPRVPGGSVAIAGVQTAIYPAAMPGGWHLIGRTDARVWDATRDPPNLLAPGARVRFRPLAVDGRSSG